MRDKLIQQQMSKRHTQYILVLCLTEKYEEQQQTYMYLKYTHTPHYHDLHPCFTFHICGNSNSPFPDMCLALLMVIFYYKWECNALKRFSVFEKFSLPTSETRKKKKPYVLEKHWTMSVNVSSMTALLSFIAIIVPK